MHVEEAYVTWYFSTILNILKVEICSVAGGMGGVGI